MTNRRLAAVIAASILLGFGYLSAQPAPSPAPPPAPERDIADVTVSGAKNADLSPREMATKADEMIGAMEKFHREVIDDQGQAKQSKDVIKLNCVNENLLAIKQLLNIADAAENELDEAIASGDRDEQIHQFGKITIAHDNAQVATNESQNCIGEDLHFIGKNDVQVTGPAISHDPTKDGDVGQTDGEDPYDTDVGLEDPAYASPFSPS